MLVIPFTYLKTLASKNFLNPVGKASLSIEDLTGVQETQGLSYFLSIVKSSIDATSNICTHVDTRLTVVVASSF